MKKYLIVTADTNDGDYISEKTQITDEDINKYTPLFYAIKSVDNRRHNWPNHEWADETLEEVYGELGELANDFQEDGFVPYGEHGVHSISSIELLVVAEETRLV